MLTDNERKLLQTAWSSGPSALLMSGYSHDQIRAFFEREDVQTELAVLDREFKHATAFDARTRYTARRGLSQLAPGAVGLLAKAMAGPTYVRGPNGEILRDARGFPILKEAELTPAQLRAAEIVVDAVGGRDAKGFDHRGDVQINVLVADGPKAITIEHDATNSTPEQQALSRERMRNAIDKLLLKLPEMRGRVQKSLGGPSTIDVPATATPAKVVKRKVPKGGPNGGSKAATG